MSVFLDNVCSLVEQERIELEHGVIYKSVTELHEQTNCGRAEAKRRLCQGNRQSIKADVLRCLDEAESMEDIKLLIGRIIHRVY